MSHLDSDALQQYQLHIKQQLKLLTPIFSKAVIGDFSAQVPVPDKEDELTEFFVGVQIILDAIREKIGELETTVGNLHAANNLIANEKARIEAILGGIGEGLVTVDHTWHTNYINEPAISLLGDNSRILGQSITEIMRLEDAEGKPFSETQHPVTQAIGKRKKVVIDITKGGAIYVHLDEGLRRRIALTITPIIRNREAAGAAIVLRDITDESNIDWAKTEIISIASHQLRTPLTAIKWYVSALQKDGDISADQAQHYLGRIHDANQHMVDLVDALLNVSRIDLGTLTVRPESVDALGVLRDVIKELNVAADSKKLRLTLQASEDLLPVFIDPNSLHIIMQNLVSNAVKYSTSDSEIKIKLEQKSDSAMLSVQDSGCGIPAEQQGRIFTKLFRASNANNVSTDGTGLGLYITKALIEQAGGKVWFESTEGKGSIFYAIIPSKVK